MKETTTFGCRIIGTGYFVPERVLTNADLEKMMDTTDEWIVTRTGIRERRIAGEDQPASFMGAKAAEMAIRNAGIDKREIDLIITATITGDYSWPSTACIIQDRLDVRGIPAFDISVACSGFVYGLDMAKSLVSSGAYSRVLLVCTEKFSTTLDWNDRNVSVLFADGAGAVVIARDERQGILGCALGADGSKAGELFQPGAGSARPLTPELVRSGAHFMRMNGKETYCNAVTRMPEALQEALERAGVTVADLDHIIFHQANMRIIDTVVERHNIPRDKLIVNVDRYGNTSAATIPIALAEAIEGGTIRPGSLVGVTAFGSGFTWGAAVFRV
jgi:3-oxoacyl-[acyl-carrier-protein] synthase-3